MTHALRLCLITLSFVLALPVGVVHAQTHKPVKPSREQKSLNSRGLKAHKAGDFTKASELFRAGLAVGDLNILYFNLGRALQKNGDCPGADEAYAKALEAPHVKGVDAKLIAEKTAEYRQELRGVCPGTLTLQCSDPEIALKVNGEAYKCGESVPLKAGEHVVAGELTGETLEARVKVVSLEEVIHKVEIARKIVKKEVEIVKPPEVVEPPEETVSTMTLTGWVLVGVGGASLIGGGVFGVMTSSTNEDIEALAGQADGGPIDATEARDLISQADTFELLQFVGYGVGVAGLVGGAVLILLDDSSEESASPTVRIAPVVEPGGGGAVLEITF